MQSLEPYLAWLRRRGLNESTIAQYELHAGRLLDGDDPFTRISNRKLSPGYRRVCRAAMLSYATFSKNVKLLESLKDVRLPAPVRQKIEVPLPESGWRALRTEIDEADYLKEPVRAVLGLMAARGLRRGDVLRLHKREVAQAVKGDTLSFLAKGERRLEFGVLPAWRGYLELLDDAFTARTAHVRELVSPRASEDSCQAAAGLHVARVLRDVGAEVGQKKLGIPPENLHPHLLRKTYASAFYVACGKDPNALREHMQWASVNVAMAYVVTDQREALDAIAEKMLK
jgi:integrase